MWTALRKFILSHKQFILYMAIGFVGVTVDYVVFIVLARKFSLNELLANSISVSLGIVNNFFLNAYFNFNKTDQLAKRLKIFYAIGLMGLAVSNTCLWLLNGVLGIWFDQLIGLVSLFLVPYRLELVKGATIVVIAIMQYFLNKRFSFKP